MTLAIRRSPRRHLLLAVPLGAAACIAIPCVTATTAPLQIAGAIWLALCAHALWGLFARAIDRRPIVRIDARGVLDTRLLPRPIEWWEIESFYPVDMSRSHVVELRLRHPHRTLASARWHMRLGLDWHRSLDLPHVCISLLLLEGNVMNVLAAIQRHAPHLLPRVEGSPRERTQEPVQTPRRSKVRL
jgi:hypothetical protein